MLARQLDRQDLAILRLLQDDARQPQRAIAEAVNLSAPAVQRRIARMEAEGVIRKTVAIIDPAAAGFPITVMAEVTLVSDRSENIAAIKAFFRAAPEVQQCYCVAGAAGFRVIFQVPSMEEYEQTTARLFADNDLVRSFSTTVVLDRVKVSLSLPL